LLCADGEFVQHGGERGEGVEDALKLGATFSVLDEAVAGDPKRVGDPVASCLAGRGLARDVALEHAPLVLCPDVTVREAPRKLADA